MDKKELLSRLKQALEYLQDNGKARTHADIALLLKTTRSNVSAAFKGNPRYLTQGFAKRFAEAYADYININWLLNGVGNMKAQRSNERPHYPAEVRAGVLTGNSDSIMSYESTLRPVIDNIPAYDFTIDVSGDSMSPLYFDGDLVACREINGVEELEPGNDYVITTRDGALLKRYVSHTMSTIRLISENSKYKPINLDTDSIIKVYKVVGSVCRNPRAAFELTKDHYLRMASEILKSKGIQDEDLLSMFDCKKYLEPYK